MRRSNRAERPSGAITRLQQQLLTLKQQVNPSMRRVASPADPPPVNISLTIQKKVQVTEQFSATTFDVDIPTILAGLPGGLTLFSSVRFARFDVWLQNYQGGPTPTPQLSSLVIHWTPQGLDSAERLTFIDSGTIGARRPAISWVPGQVFRNTWFPVADTNTLFVIDNDSGQEISVTIQATIEARTV
jgi:hypothetical protein